MRIVVALPFAALVVLFVRGAWRLRTGKRPGIGPPRLLAAAVGFAALALALSDAMHAAAHALFVAHMAQHLLLMSIAAPALLLADPFAVTLWGLPERARRAAGRLVMPGRRVRRLFAAVTRMSVTWPTYVTVLWLWHVPAPYEAALRSSVLHDVEHVLFFLAALLFWWPVLGPGPRVTPRPHSAWLVVYLVLGALQNTALGLLLSSRAEPLYATYATSAPTWGVSPADDQVWGGVLMWSVGSTIDMAAVLCVVARALSDASVRAEGPGGHAIWR